MAKDGDMSGGDSGDRIEELSRVIERLSEKNRELEQIVYVASHDLRSPLVNVDGFSGELKRSMAELKTLLQKADLSGELRREVDFLIDEDMPESIHFILSGIAKMNALLSGLLRYSRLGRSPVSMIPLDMDRLIGEVTDALGFQVQEKGAKVLAESLPPCRGDRLQVNQVFTNLLDNALKYLDPERPGEIRVYGETRGSKVVYAVADNGVGVDPGHREKVFEIFQRANPGMAEGQGLGLTLVRTILHKHGGEVWFTSEPGVGSTFFVSLPVSEQGGAAAQADGGAGKGET